MLHLPPLVATDSKLVADLDTASTGLSRFGVDVPHAARGISWHSLPGEALKEARAKAEKGKEKEKLGSFVTCACKLVLTEQAGSGMEVCEVAAS